MKSRRVTFDNTGASLFLCANTNVIVFRKLRRYSLGRCLPVGYFPKKTFERTDSSKTRARVSARSGTGQT